MIPVDQPGAFSPAGHPLRLLRSVAAAAACVTTAGIGHASAGGQLCGSSVLAVFAGSAVIAWLLSARRVTLAQIVGLLLLCQVGVHLSSSDAAMTMDASMVASHLVAMLTSAALLSRGERFVWLVGERLAIRVAPIVAVASIVPSIRPLTPAVAPRSRHDVMLAHSRALRGPPTED